MVLKANDVLTPMLELIVKTGLTLQMAERILTVLDYDVEAIVITVKPERKNFLDIATLLSLFY